MDKKARGNKSVKKYYYSAITRRHNYIKDNNLLGKVLNEIEKKEVSELLDQEHQLKEACNREESECLQGGSLVYDYFDALSYIKSYH